MKRQRQERAAERAWEKDHPHDDEGGSTEEDVNRWLEGLAKVVPVFEHEVVVGLNPESSSESHSEIQSDNTPDMIYREHVRSIESTKLRLRIGRVIT